VISGAASHGSSTPAPMIWTLPVVVWPPLVPPPLLVRLSVKDPLVVPLSMS
jgi:hypothetical protein